MYHVYPHPSYNAYLLISAYLVSIVTAVDFSSRVLSI